jgi:hypothetical protein
LAQLGQAQRGGIFGQLGQRGNQRIGEHGWRGVFGLADVKRDLADALGRRDALHGFVQAGEWVGMKLVEVAVHGVILVDWAALNGVSGCIKEAAL